jgi:hypothetical protein
MDRRGAGLGRGWMRSWTHCRVTASRSASGKTTSRRDSGPAGGVWQGINKPTGAMASAIWVNRLLGPQALVFLTMDGESLRAGLTVEKSEGA